MQLEDYFDFEKFTTEYGEAECIRIKGHRIDIEMVIDEFLAGKQPNEILERFPTLSLEKIYATIAYYLHNREEIDAYRERGKALAEAYYQEYLQHGPYWLRDKALGKLGEATPRNE